jgi:hypothetical protein
MKRAISVMQKRGRPATGKTPTIALRATDEFRGTVERWAAKQGDKPTLSEAIRRLVEIGLKREKPSKTISKPTKAARAAELAAKAIDKMIDPSAPAAERDQRRRRLTKGPPEFREDRVDQPKAKGK